MAYAADNETIEGIRSSLQEIEDNEKMEEEEEERVQTLAMILLMNFPIPPKVNLHKSDPEVSSSSRSRRT